nr:MAG TPA: helix-turn-helix domain protein [Bacteriophage sp.]
MAARLTDRQKKKILADYVQLGSYNAAAKVNKCSPNSVKNIVQGNADFAELCKQKNEENTADVLAYMDENKNLVCSFIGLGLKALNDPDKVKDANLTQITTAMGKMIDKWAMISSAPANTAQEDALSQSLRAMAEELESDDQP